MVQVNAHIQGSALVLDDPRALPLPDGTRVRVLVEVIDEHKSSPPAKKHCFEPLDIHIDPELARAIAQDPEFRIEES